MATILATQTAILDSLLSPGPLSDTLDEALLLTGKAFDFAETALLIPARPATETIRHVTGNSVGLDCALAAVEAALKRESCGQLMLDTVARGNCLPLRSAWFQAIDDSDDNHSRGGVLIGLFKDTRVPCALESAAFKAIATAFRLATRERAEQVAANTRRSIAENLAHGLVMFDPQDRLLIANSRFGDIFPRLRPIARAGADYRDLISAELDCALSHASAQIRKSIMDKRLHAHRQHCAFSIEHQLGDTLWLKVDEHRSDDGCTVIAYTDVSEIKKREAHIQHMALHDALTGLPNSALFRDRAQKALNDKERRGGQAAILCVDLDNFKLVNDTLGHPAGDAVLREVATRLRAAVRLGDTVARVGGDEFAIVIDNAEHDFAVELVAVRIIEGIGRPFKIDGNQVMIGASAGIAISDDTTADPDHLLRNADMALYRAKAQGKNAYCFFNDEMGEHARARHRLESDLRLALREGRLELHFQPQISVSAGTITGFEALVRWHHPVRGVIPPLEFLAVAEETGLIQRLGDWILEHACKTAVTWSKPAKIAVNLSPTQFRRRDLAQTIRQTLEITGLDPARLELEIAESVLFHDSTQALTTLHALKEIGVRLALDRFGAGYSSLGNLRSFPFNKIKIDQSFVSEIDSKSGAAAFIRAIVGLGNSLGIETTAEGVETRNQLSRVKIEGCSEIQGFYYSHARPGDEVEKLLAGKIDNFPSCGLRELSF